MRERRIGEGSKRGRNRGRVKRDSSDKREENRGRIEDEELREGKKR
jgi:hypothetical protein